MSPHVDTHAHVFTRRLGLVADRRYTPDYDATLADYLRQLESGGIRHGVLVQPSFLGFDNNYLCACVDAEPSRLRGVVVVAADEGAAGVERYARRRIVGMRHNLIGRDPGLPLRNAWDDVHTAAAAAGWHVELHTEARHLPPLIDHFSGRGITIVVDHFGRPDPETGVADPGFQHLLKRAGAGDAQIYVKMSAPYRLKGADPCAYADALLTHIGADRLLWGSDWPWTQNEDRHTYRQTVAWLSQWLSDHDQADIIARMNRAAERVFRF